MLKFAASSSNSAAGLTTGPFRGSERAEYVAPDIQPYPQSRPSLQTWPTEVNTAHVDTLWEDCGEWATTLQDGQRANTSPELPLVDTSEESGENDMSSGSEDSKKRQLPTHVNGQLVTTLMLRNLPPRVTQQQLMQCMPSPYQARFNLLHVPTKGTNTATITHSSGYAFVNFETHADAVDFYEQWNWQLIQFPTTGSVTGCSRVLKIEAATHQGFHTNLSKWRRNMRGLLNPSMLPAIFIGGRRHHFWQYIRGMQRASDGSALPGTQMVTQSVGQNSTQNGTQIGSQSTSPGDLVFNGTQNNMQIGSQSSSSGGLVSNEHRVVLQILSL